MTFNQWLVKNGYFPIDIIIANYRNNKYLTEEEIQERIDILRDEYECWCDKR